MNQNTKDFIKKHLAFILTISTTYILGIALILIQCLAQKDGENYFEIFLESIVPTTITYVLGCVWVNIVEIVQNQTEHYVWNLITCFFVFLYALLFSAYLITGFTFVWIFIEFVATLLMLTLNILCYREKSLHRKHSLVS